jgi:hypothetical protein
MGFRWVLHDLKGNDLRDTELFDSQADAEAWMGANWARLLDEGAESVSLMDGAEHVYKMGLREE